MKDAQTPPLTFSYVAPELLDVVWEDAEKLLAPAIATSDGKFTSASVREALDHQMLILWLVSEGTTPIAAITTRVIVFPTRRALAMDWIGGSRMKEWLPIAMPIIREYAAYQKCEHLEGYGRRAWERWLAPHGWKPDYIAYRMELTDE